MLDFTVATLTIEGLTNYSQSRKHDVPKLEGERDDAYDVRTWRERLNLNEDGTRIVIPAHGMQQAIVSAAKYSKRQIPGQGKATWTAKFGAGIMILEDPEIDTPLDQVGMVVINANSDGIRGSGKRVTRRYPFVGKGWRSSFDVQVIDPIITRDVFEEMVSIAGMFIGIGRFRPQNGGTIGRFRVAGLEWKDNRGLVRPRKAA